MGFVRADDVFEVLAMLEYGSKRKAIAVTALNRDSSRSHTVFSIVVDRRVRVILCLCVYVFITLPLRPIRRS